IDAAPTLGFLGSRIRCRLKMTSSAVTVLPLWTSIPGRILTTQESALPCSASIDSATIMSTGPKLGGRTASGSYRFQHRMMSVSAVGRWASIVSLAPPPVAPTLRLPPLLRVPVEGGLDFAVPPPPPPPPPPEPPLLPPHAARRPPADSAAPPASAP